MRSSREAFSTNRQTVRFDVTATIRCGGAAPQGHGLRTGSRRRRNVATPPGGSSSCNWSCPAARRRVGHDQNRFNFPSAPSQPAAVAHPVPAAPARRRTTSRRRRASSPCSRSGAPRSRRPQGGAQPAGASVRHDRRPDPAALPARHRGAGAAPRRDPHQTAGPVARAPADLPPVPGDQVGRRDLGTSLPFLSASPGSSSPTWRRRALSPFISPAATRPPAASQT